YGPWSDGMSFNLTSGNLPGKATLVSPSGSISNSQPTYTWNAVSNATWYHLWVTDSSGNRINQWYSASAVNCSSGSGTCSIRPSVTLRAGSGTWWIRTYNDNGYGPWSDGMSFNLSGTTGGWTQNFTSTPTGWQQDAGSWSVVSGRYWYTEGRSVGLSNTSTYNQTYTDVDFSAKLWRNGDDSSSNRIWVRASGSILSNGYFSNGYYFQYTRNGSVSVWKRVNGNETAVKNWSSSSAVNTGSAWNVLRAVVQGDRMSFYVNDILVWSGRDSSLSSGKVGVGMHFYRSSTGNALWVDWAKLSIPSLTLGSESVIYEEKKQNINGRDETMGHSGGVVD
uniref:hypothetical protein n=1 Tax=Desulfonatronovibrio magnus TaxID=698827 RepID=UPI0005EB359D